MSSPTMEDQIDHTFMNKKIREPIEDIGMKRGTETASDHHQVVATRAKLKLKKHWIIGQAAVWPDKDSSVVTMNQKDVHKMFAMINQDSNLVNLEKMSLQ